jgi:hypothetical protein
MNTRIKQIAVATKEHVFRNRGKYAVAGTSLVFLALLRSNAKTWNAFLEKHELMDEYYAEVDA